MSKLHNTVDYSRINSANKHSEIPFPIAFRELLHNAQAYGAKNAVAFSFKRNAVYYCALAHDGLGFDSLSHIMEAMEFNKSGGNGVQGSGMKTAIYPLGQSPLKSSLMVYSKTQDGNTYTCKLSHTSETTLQIADVSLNWNAFLESMLQNSSKNYGVIYVLQYRAPKADVSLTTTKNIFTLYDLMPSIKDDLNLRYVSKVLRENEYINANGNHPLAIKFYKHRKDFIDDFCFKKFSINVENVQVMDADRDTDQSALNLGAEIILEVFPNFIHENAGRPAPIDKHLKIYTNERMTVNDIVSHNLFVYHDYNLQSQNVDRANQDPFYAYDTNSARWMCDDLGIPDIQQGVKREVNKAVLESFFTPDMIDRSNHVHSLSDCNSWKPIVRMKVKLKNVQNIHDYRIGSIDNFFYAEDNNKVKRIVKRVLNKARSENSHELRSFNEYIKQFEPKRLAKPLHITQAKGVNTSHDRVAVFLTAQGVKDCQGLTFRNKQKLEENAQLKYIPVGTTRGIEVYLKDKDENVLDCDISPIIDIGLEIRKDRFKAGVYTLHTTDYLKMIDGKPEATNADSHRNGQNYYPKKNYLVKVNGNTNFLRLNVEVVEVKTFEKKEQNTENKTDSKKIYDIYCNDTQNPHLIYAKWDGNFLKLNLSNPIIKQLVFNDEKYSKTLTDLYRSMENVAKDFYGVDNEVDRYGIEGRRKLEDDYGDPQAYLLNLVLKTMLNESPLAVKLRNAHEDRLKKTAAIEQAVAQEQDMHLIE